MARRSEFVLLMGTGNKEAKVVRQLSQRALRLAMKVKGAPPPWQVLRSDELRRFWSASTGLADKFSELAQQCAVATNEVERLKRALRASESDLAKALGEDLDSDVSS